MVVTGEGNDDAARVGRRRLLRAISSTLIADLSCSAFGAMMSSLMHVRLKDTPRLTKGQHTAATTPSFMARTDKSNYRKPFPLLVGLEEQGVKLSRIPCFPPVSLLFPRGISLDIISILRPAYLVAPISHQDVGSAERPLDGEDSPGALN